MAVLGLVAVVVLVGAAGYFGLSAADTGSSHTVTTCAPAAAPQCKGTGNTTAATPDATLLALAR